MVGIWLGSGWDLVAIWWDLVGIWRDLVGGAAVLLSAKVGSMPWDLATPAAGAADSQPQASSGRHLVRFRPPFDSLPTAIRFGSHPAHISCRVSMPGTVKGLHRLPRRSTK